jgi:SAM-dependent methyltransferase
MANQYQSFPSARGASRSVAKLRALHLPELRGRSFLDVGCNEGFFCAIAQHAGATRVVGIEMNAAYLARASARFPGIEFRHQSWDEPIEGRFDVILFSSAIHYARDQPALIRKLLGLLQPGGVLVLELGIVQETGDDYVWVRRSTGNRCAYATPTVLRRELADFDVREMGPSVNQSGDPVPRFVLHIRARTIAAADAARGDDGRPAVVFFDAPSRSGKSSVVRHLMRGAGGIASLSIDFVLNRMQGEEAKRLPAHAAVIRSVERFCREQSPRADLTLAALAEQGLLPEFAAYVEASCNMAEERVTIWDGYLPPAAKEPVRAYFERRGYAVWNAAARRSFLLPQIDVAALTSSARSMSSAAAAIDESAVEDLRALQLPLIRGRSVALIGPCGAALAALLRAAEPAQLFEFPDTASLVESVDLVVLLGSPLANDALQRCADALCRRLLPGGLLVIAMPPDPSRPSAEVSQELAMRLRRLLPEYATRRIGMAGGRPQTHLPAVVHLQRLDPIVLFVESADPGERAWLAGKLCERGAAQRMALADLVARVGTGAELPAVPLLVCEGNVDAAGRAKVHLALEQRGRVIWELMQRGKSAYRELDAAAVLAVAFPDAEGQAPQTHPSPLERMRAFVARLLRPDAAAAPPPPAATAPRSADLTREGDAATPRAAEVVIVPPPAAPAAEHASAVPAAAPHGSNAHSAKRNVRGRLEGAVRRPKGIGISGWAFDPRTGRGVAEFVVACGDAQVEPARITRRVRAKLNARHGLAADAEIGFTVFVPYGALGGEARVAYLSAARSPHEVWRVGCRIAAGGGIDWLESAPHFAVAVPVA